MRNALLQKRLKSATTLFGALLLLALCVGTRYSTLFQCRSFDANPSSVPSPLSDFDSEGDFGNDKSEEPVENEAKGKIAEARLESAENPSGLKVFSDSPRFRMASDSQKALAHIPVPLRPPRA